MNYPTKSKTLTCPWCLTVGMSYKHYGNYIKCKCDRKDSFCTYKGNIARGEMTDDQLREIYKQEDFEEL